MLSDSRLWNRPWEQVEQAGHSTEHRQPDPQGYALEPSREQTIGIVMEGLRGQIPVSELPRGEGIAPTVHHRWSKTFLNAGKNGLNQ